MSPESIRGILLANAARLLTINGVEPVRVRLSIRGGLSKEAEFRLRADRAELPSDTPSAGDDMEFLQSHFFSSLERQIVLACENGPRSAKEIAHDVEGDPEPGSRLKLVIAQLCDRQCLVRGTDGYRVSDPRLVEIARQNATTARQSPVAAEE